MPAKKLIVCVCRGNILRSAVAEKLIHKHLISRGLGNKYKTISRGVQGTVVDPKPVRHKNITYYKTLYPKLKPILDKLNIDLTNHNSQPISYNEAKNASIIIAMDKSTRRLLNILFPGTVHYTFLFSDLVKRNDDIADIPYYKPTYSVRTVNEINQALDISADDFFTFINQH